MGLRYRWSSSAPDGAAPDGGPRQPEAAPEDDHEQAEAVAVGVSEEADKPDDRNEQSDEPEDELTDGRPEGQGRGTDTRSLWPDQKLSTARYASVLLLQGESVVAVAERLGHHNASLVLSTYGHLMPDSEDGSRRAVDTAWASSAPPVPHEERQAL